MKTQQRDSWCAPAAIQNALRMLGKRVGQARIARLAGTCVKYGTTEQGIVDACSSLGFHALISSFKFERDGIDFVKRVVPSVPLILCVDRWEHWVTVIATTKDRALVVDPEKSELARSELHLLPVSWSRLAKRWRAARADHNGLPYYAISISHTLGLS